MFESFLAMPKTIPHCDRNFVAWHGGVPYYGFWSVLVEDLTWLKLFDAARIHVKELIHPGYQRAPHITIAACGLLEQKHFSAEHLKRQILALSEAMIVPFFLNAGALNSFASAPYITVEDPTGSLNQIRERLSVISKEDDPGQYQPHVTLGLYRDAFDTLHVADRLREFQRVPISPMLVTELAFCAFATKEIQGQVSVLERVRPNCSNVSKSP